MDEVHEKAQPPVSRYPYAWLVWTVGGIGVALLAFDHWAHMLGVLPYLVILACPLMHLVMHRGHKHGGHDDHQ